MKIWIPFLALLLLTSKGTAQAPIEFWKKKYNSYYQAMSGHKMLVTFSQSKYAAGDTAFFSIQLFENELTRVKAKRILDFNVIDSEGKSVQHFLFSVLNGEGYNQWIVPDLPSGVYRLAIHHYGLKAFYPEVIYQKPIEIVKSGVLQPIQRPSRVTIEGGHLIGGMVSSVLVAATPLDSIKLIDSSGFILTNGIVQADGFCSLTIRPTYKQKYFITANNDTTRTSLPVVEEDGVNMGVKFSSSNTLQSVTIKIPPKSRYNKERLTLIVSQRNLVLEVIELLMEKDSLDINLQTSNWNDGLIHLAVLRSNGQLLAFRNLYHHTSNNFILNMNIPKLSYQPREKVDVEFDFTDSSGNPVDGLFSVSVIDKKYDQIQALNVWYDSSFDIDFAMEDFAWNEFRLENLKTIDHHVLTQSKPQPWDRILSGMNPLKDFRFKSNIERVGRAYSDSTKKPLLNGSNVLLYLQQAHQRYQFTINDGLILMPMSDFYGKDELLMMAETQVYVGGESMGQVVPDFWVDWNGEDIKWPSSIKVKETATADPYALYVNQNRLIRKSFDTFLSQQGRSSTSNEQQNFLPPYDLSVTVTDYEPFVDMEELIREIVPSLQHRKTRKGPIVLVSLPDPLKVTGDPTYIIDGFATKNTSYFMSLKPSEISTIAIISHPKKLIPLGLFGKNGLVLVRTKNGNTRPPINRSLQIEGLSKPKFLEERKQRPNDNKPNFNSLVFWYPSAKIDTSGKANLSFYMTDDLGVYQILVRGISPSGIPFYVSKDINVNLQGSK
ncbi:MAG: hypothetical protein HYZ44_13910 [Bacteroidetes bacterium]|nr:hypothetical protein [Bacteroidota bacterium]